jgi:hypothetical protein
MAGNRGWKESIDPALLSLRLRFASQVHNWISVPSSRYTGGRGVREYITIEVLRKRIIWRVLEDGTYRELAGEPDGVYRSRTFPGLWLNPDAFWAFDEAALDALLERGLASEEHVTFVRQLNSNHRG